MSKYQLWSTDEYGQSSILASSEDAAGLIKDAKSRVQSDNIENALTADEKCRNWETGFIELLDAETGEVIDDAVYAGKDSTGHPAVLMLDGQSVLTKLSECDCAIRVYLGNINKDEPLYASNERGKVIDDISHSSLLGKLFYFIRRIG
jgi:hypothetical protein